ncbi:unnamed protein product [Ectocarpus sp. 12 AP-2014]
MQKSPPLPKVGAADRSQRTPRAGAVSKCYTNVGARETDSASPHNTCCLLNVHSGYAAVITPFFLFWCYRCCCCCCQLVGDFILPEDDDKCFQHVQHIRVFLFSRPRV